MKARVDVATDTAMVGAWDAQRNLTPLTRSELQHLPRVLEGETATGQLFLLNTGADGGGPVDVYVNETIASDVQVRLKPVEGTFLLTVPSGSLLIAGAEGYRSSAPGAIHDAVIRIPGGDYALRCYAPRDSEQAPSSEEALRKLVGDADLGYYDRMNSIGCVGGALTLSLFPVLSLALSWKLALAVTVLVFLGYFALLQFLLTRTARYRRLHEIVPVFRLQHEDPWLVFELRGVESRGGLHGGSASL